MKPAGFIVLLLLSTTMVAQVKYIKPGQGAKLFGAAYTKVNETGIFIGQFGFTKRGRFGVGANYQHSVNPVSNGLGVQVEYSLFRPAENMIPGINILGGFSMAWHTTTQYYAYSIPNP